jgi:uncharacterized integral membrane protein
MALLHRDRDHDHDHDVRVPDHPPDDWVAPAPAAAAPTTTASPVVVRRNSAGQTFRAVLATVCALAIAAFLVLNPDETEIDLGFDTFTSPLWATVGIAAGVGIVLGYLVGHRRCRRPHIDA